ncbi:MAG: glutaminyl-peptide cyclotransferase [Acidobacteria bacterium]|nr:glutaminyl-peptide cyclotransferase [Acidobacteriota bacterium]MBI3423824.1 glutaminyl-peptide cyclotransferase [Acidobacteriota bacterium]
MPLTAPVRVPVYTYEVVNVYPHDAAAFTQGLVFYQGALFESTGLNGSSSLRKVELETGRVLKKLDVPSQYFAEGLALFNGRLLQLTWQNHVGFVYDQETFQQLNTFSYSGEGWGLANDGKSLILSDGSNQIRFLDPNTFQVQRTITVRDRGQAVARLNELEYVNGEIFANIWYTDRVARINPADGSVVGWIELNGLLTPQDGSRADVLNGIAYDAATNRLFVTGKLWPKLFEIKLKVGRNEVRR